MQIPIDLAFVEEERPGEGIDMKGFAIYRLFRGVHHGERCKKTQKENR